MAYVDYEGNNGSYQPPDIWSESGGQGISDPAPRANTPPDPNSPAELARLNAIYGPGGTETTKRAPTSTWNPQQEVWNTPAPSASNDQWILDALASAQSTDDPNYWLGKWRSGELGTDRNFVIDAINRGDGALAVRNGTVQKRGAGGGGPAAPAAAPGPNPGGYTDPSSMLYLQQLMDRLNQAKQPQDTQVYDLLKSLALQRVEALKAPPYSAADDAALITQYRQPLTQARDQAKQRAALDLSRRGIGPTSGVFQDRMKQIDQAYIGGVAQGANQMGVNAVALKQQNAQQQLQILSSLLAANNTQYDRTSAQGDKAVDIAKMFPDFDAQRLDQLLRASGDTSGSSALSSLMSLGNLNLNTIGLNNSNDQANAAAWGKIIATILGSL